MNVKVQVVTFTDDGEEVIREVACVERDELTPASLGLSIADSKGILQGIQEVVVEWQMHEYLDRIGICIFCLPPSASWGGQKTNMSGKGSDDRVAMTV